MDAAVCAEPILSSSLASGATRILAKPFDAIASRFILTVEFATQDWVKNNAAAARRFASAMQACGRWANAHHDETAGMLAKFANIDVAVIRSSTRSSSGRQSYPGAAPAVPRRCIQVRRPKPSRSRH